MTGSHHVIVYNDLVRYEFTIRQNITIVRGDSGTGKTNLIRMLEQYDRFGENSGVTVACDKPCAVVSGKFWRTAIAEADSHILFFDEDEEHVAGAEFGSRHFCVEKQFL